MFAAWKSTHFRKDQGFLDSGKEASQMSQNQPDLVSLTSHQPEIHGLQSDLSLARNACQEEGGCGRKSKQRWKGCASADTTVKGGREKMVEQKAGFPCREAPLLHHF